MAVSGEGIAVVAPPDADPDIFCQPMLAADASVLGEDAVDIQCTVQVSVLGNSVSPVRCL